MAGIRLLVAIGSVAVLLSAACGDRDGSSGEGTPPGPTSPIDTIAYSDAEPGQTDLPATYTIRSDGTGRTLLVGASTSPAWSPDGRRVAVGQDGIRLYDAFGRHGRDLGRGLGLCDEPSWSPDGRRIACIGPSDGRSMSLVYDDPPGLWSVDIRTTSAQRLPVDLGAGGWGEYPDAPSWSPDATRLVFSDGAGTVRVLDLRSGDLRTVGRGTCPDWSPRGGWIAYSTGHAIVVSRADGTRRRTVATSRNQVQEPAWSPDGTRIAYAEFSEGPGSSVWGVDRGLRVVAATGGTVRTLTSTGFDPDWRPRG